MSDKPKIQGVVEGRKGFIRVIEIVIFAFMLFSVLLPNFFRYSDHNDWGDTKNQILSHDLLFALEKKGLLDEILVSEPITDEPNLMLAHEYDIEILKNLSEEIFPVTYDFEYEVKNAAAPRISVGCVCTEDEEDWLKSRILTPSYPTYEFSVKRIGLENLSGTFDTFVIFGQENLVFYRNSIYEKLQEGRGFVMVTSFDSAPDEITAELFDVNYTGGDFEDRSLYFSNISDPLTSGIAKRFNSNILRLETSGAGLSGEIGLGENKYDLIQRAEYHCINISGCSDCLHENETCEIPGVAKIELFQIDPLYGEWADLKLSSPLANPRDYAYFDRVPFRISKSGSTVLTDISGTYAFANARVLDYSTGYETLPRTFWIYDYDRTKDDLNLLLKTGIIWSSGEHYFVFGKTVPSRRTVATHFYTELNGNGVPFMVKLHIWGY